MSTTPEPAEALTTATRIVHRGLESLSCDLNRWAYNAASHGRHLAARDLAHARRLIDDLHSVLDDWVKKGSVE